MSDDDETGRVVAEVDSELKENAKRILPHGGITEVIEEALETVVFGGGWDKRSVIDLQLQEKRQDLREERKKRRNAEAAIETLEEEIRSLEHKRDQVESEQDRLDGALWSFEQSFRAGEFNAVKENSQIRSIASEFHMDVSDVIDTLEDRNPDVPDYAFKAPGLTRKTWTGLPEELVDMPVDQRKDRVNGGGDE